MIPLEVSYSAALLGITFVNAGTIVTICMAGADAPACGGGEGRTLSLGGKTVVDGDTLGVYFGENTWPLRVIPPAPIILTISVSWI